LSDPSRNIFSYETQIDRKKRESLLNQRSFLIWFTGLSASGKSTVGNHLEQKLHKLEYITFMLDGDNLRNALNQDLGFSDEDRKENIRRVGHVSKLMIDAGVIVLCTFISPFEEDRKFVRELAGNGNFVEVFVDCPLETCIERDEKGLYKKAINNEIKDFTGISSPYEKPQKPELIVDTGKMDVDDAVDHIMEYLINNNYIKRKRQ